MSTSDLPLPDDVRSEAEMRGHKLRPADRANLDVTARWACENCGAGLHLRGMATYTGSVLRRACGARERRS